ncbi:hypothetical protein [Chelativorans sp. M5D2P16]|uniref:hypothetical protein n=1 Tax=Chelativorans sp. M5D2P16 TaxID=3095678 RepID=UPI002ACA411C|nr:hypothetical protein [Chelativorans sp. M5D2P16]MDZ5696008.1 hypothetical protein [Chelativorans sp. M5D2P16]
MQRLPVGQNFWAFGRVLSHVAPVLIGGGIRLFSQTGMEPVRLEKAEVSQARQIANMRFRFAG